MSKICIFIFMHLFMTVLFNGLTPVFGASCIKTSTKFKLSGSWYGLYSL